MIKVIGYAEITVNVNCPQCGKNFDCLSDGHDDDGDIVDSLLENTTSSCTDMDYRLTCPDCDTEFILDEFQY